MAQPLSMAVEASDMGVLSLSATSEKLTKLVLTGCNDKYGAAPLKTIDLHPVLNFSCLRFLSMANLKLVELPLEIGRLVLLCALDVRKNLIEKLPESITSLTALEHFNASYNRLELLPSSPCCLTCLRNFVVASNRILSLPNSFKALSSLGMADIGVNQLTRIPLMLANVTNVKLSKNLLTHVGEEVLSMKALERLALSGNQISELQSLSELEYLTVLHIDNCRLTRLPSLSDGLCYLNVSYNRIEHLPSTIGVLSRLDTLFADHNELRSIPNELRGMISLKFLELEGNMLESLPPDLCLISSLMYLAVHQNQLTVLPPDILRLPMISRLLMQKNSISNVRESELNAMYQNGNDSAIFFAKNKLSLKPRYNMPLYFPSVSAMYAARQNFGVGIDHGPAFAHNTDEYLPLDPMHNSDLLISFSKSFLRYLSQLQRDSSVAVHRISLSPAFTLNKNIMEVMHSLAQSSMQGKRAIVEPCDWMWANVSWAACSGTQTWTTLFQPLDGRRKEEMPEEDNCSVSFSADSQVLPEHMKGLLRVSACANFVFQFGSEMEKLAFKARREIGWLDSDKVLGLHIRRGDALGTNLSEGTIRRWGSLLEDYLEYADTMCERYGYNTLYISTESQEEIEKAKKLRPAYKILSLNISRDFFPSTRTKTSAGTNFIEDMVQDDPSAIEPIVISGLLDLYFLHLCQGLVGSYSMFSQFAWYLMIGRLQHIPPFVCL